MGRQPPSRSSHARLLARLCQKELREILRDRRTIITLILMPLMVYPILSVIMHRFLLSGAAPEASNGFVIGFDSEASAEAMQGYLALGHALVTQRDGPPAGGRSRGWRGAPPVQAFAGVGKGRGAAAVQGGDAAAILRDFAAIQWVIVEDLDRALSQGQLDLAVTGRLESRPNARPLAVDASLPAARFQLLHRPASTASQRALHFVERYLQAVNSNYLQQRVQALGGELWLPVQLDAVARSGGTSRAVSLASLVPLILILMTITGAVYPAIDLTAGERERGTLEALLTAPVRRFDLLLAKYVAVVVVALLTAAANLVAMTVTLFSAGLSEAVFGDAVLSWRVMLAVFSLLVLFAAFFSAVLLAITSFARSFKEAQAYLIPLMLISLVPGMISLSPGVAFEGLLTVTPLVNIVLLARDLLQGHVDSSSAALAVISTALYAAGAVSLAARIFGADAVIYGSSGWSDWLRRPETPQPAASLASSLLFLAVLLPLYILLASFLVQLKETSLTFRLSSASWITMGLFGLLPILVGLICRVRLLAAFRLERASAAAYLGATLLGVSLWPLVHELFLLHRVLGIGTLSPQQVAAARELVESWQQLSPAFLLLTMAVVPAVFEELFFRGYLFSSLLAATSARQAILISALLFGVFHVVTSALATERFLPSTCMGLVLGWVSWKTGSVLPGMLLHACHNGLLVSVGYYQDWLAAQRWGAEGQVHLPVAWLTWAALGTLCGLLILGLAGRRRTVVACTSSSATPHQAA